MSETSANVMLDIDRKLAKLRPIPSERCIFRVHDRLRNENNKAYEPNVVAIGPYHHGKDNLQPMEEHKLRYLQQLLQHREETSAKRYIQVMREYENRAREFYAEPISLESNEFVEMMLLDSCFIVELLRKYMIAKQTERVPNDYIFQINHFRLGIRRDLMLFENQIPFFIVRELFNMTKNSSDPLDNLVGMCVSFFDSITPSRCLEAPSLNPREDDIEHLLGLLHYCCCHEFHSISQRNTVGKEDKSLKSTKQLQEAGIKFQKIEGRNLFDIRFVNGTMEIPTLQVEDNTESFLRNMVAYEECLLDTSRKHFAAYYLFMDKLVNTSEDVEILTDHGIIHNLLGDNEVVATIFNKLGNNIIESYICYEEVYKNVDEHCREKWNLWLAILRRKYFNNPWALISFVAAVVLLLLTALQTIFTIHPVGK